MSRGSGSHILSITIALNFYVAAFLLLFAGIIKMASPVTGELLESLYELDLFEYNTMLIISRIQPWVEIFLGFIALVGWRPELIAKVMSLLYAVFTVLILYASQGYFLLPIDCGCFGKGDGAPVYLLLLRNVTISILLVCYDDSYRRWTLYYGIRKRLENKIL